ncbi:MAG: sodium-dependent transporter, partial [Lachnospiraceae bacterium]|nr:sodium-dependent transporter [Lachnospiraceae bacterium]
MNRERLGSRMGFIMLSAGCAIGCGNVWKFPWMCGQNGGGSFMLVYLICLIILGIPALVMEFSIGRAAQSSPLYMYRKLEQPGQKWHLFGWLCLIGNISLMAFYSVVCGWIIYYFYRFVTGDAAVLDFNAMVADPQINVVFLLITLLIAFLVLSYHLQGGLERFSKIMMSALLILMIVLAGHSLLL